VKLQSKTFLQFVQADSDIKSSNSSDSWKGTFFNLEILLTRTRTRDLMVKVGWEIVDFAFRLSAS
jgi:hypothetical protein